MKALLYPIADEESIYSIVINEKNFPRDKHLTKIKSDVFKRYETYLNDFDKLISESKLALTSKQKEALLHSWSSPTKEIKKLKVDIRSAQTDEFKKTCPYCLIHFSNTFDHYFPQSQYGEFAILGKNLIPCCTICNEYKSSKVYDLNHERHVIHYFYDNIPDSNILHAKILMRNSTPVAEFYLENRGVLSANLFSKVERHFETLSLISRYDSESVTIFGDCRVDARSYLPTSLTDLRQSLLRKATQEQKRYGSNYYVASLYIAIADSDETLNWLLS